MSERFGRFDYTALDPGTVTPFGTVVVCPVCGRHGAATQITKPLEGGPYSVVVHGGHSTWPNTLARSADDYCRVPDTE